MLLQIMPPYVAFNIKKHKPYVKCGWRYQEPNSFTTSLALENEGGMLF